MSPDGAGISVPRGSQDMQSPATGQGGDRGVCPLGDPSLLNPHSSPCPPCYSPRAPSLWGDPSSVTPRWGAGPQGGAHGSSRLRNWSRVNAVTLNMSGNNDFKNVSFCKLIKAHARVPGSRGSEL